MKFSVGHSGLPWYAVGAAVDIAVDISVDLVVEIEVEIAMASAMGLRGVPLLAAVFHRSPWNVLGSPWKVRGCP